MCPPGYTCSLQTHFCIGEGNLGYDLLFLECFARSSPLKVLSGLVQNPEILNDTKKVVDFLFSEFSKDPMCSHDYFFSLKHMNHFRRMLICPDFECGNQSESSGSVYGNWIGLLPPRSYSCGFKLSCSTDVAYYHAEITTELECGTFSTCPFSEGCDGSYECVLCTDPTICETILSPDGTPILSREACENTKVCLSPNGTISYTKDEQECRNLFSKCFWSDDPSVEATCPNCGSEMGCNSNGMCNSEYYFQTFYQQKDADGACFGILNPYGPDIGSPIFILGGGGSQSYAKGPTAWLTGPGGVIAHDIWEEKNCSSDHLVTIHQKHLTGMWIKRNLSQEECSNVLNLCYAKFTNLNHLSIGSSLQHKVLDEQNF
eukprot:TRINITY_DN6809_c1_g2_i1.p1 TRINITY_DN6809_c1_g2~~TRINITY_DN6809_c1_g2_i1.p1  ORF type:complete len:406 (+),score=64.72 TRINITY_DN6809_c1_g2_i1:99-1220(+)